MNQFFPRVAIMSFVIVLTCSFLTAAQAVETVPLSGLPVLVEPGTENDMIPFSGADVSTAVLRKKAQLSCANAMEAAGEAKRAMQADRPTYDNQPRGQEYRLAYDEYMRLKDLCILNTKALTERLAAEENGDRSTGSIDPTDPLTAQWAGTWYVERSYFYSTFGRSVHSLQLKVKISREGCEVSIEKENLAFDGTSYLSEKGYNCRVRGRTLTFYSFHRNDKEDRMDYVFLHSGLTLKGDFSGIISGKPAGGKCTGEKAGY